MHDILQIHNNVLRDRQYSIEHSLIQANHATSILIVLYTYTSNLSISKLTDIHSPLANFAIHRDLGPYVGNNTTLTYNINLTIHLVLSFIHPKFHIDYG